MHGFIVNAIVTIKHETLELEEFMFGERMNSTHQVMSALCYVQMFGELEMHREYIQIFNEEICLMCVEDFAILELGYFTKSYIMQILQMEKQKSF